MAKKEQIETIGANIMNAINDGDIHATSDIVALINKGFMSDKAKAKLTDKIAKLEEKVAAMKAAAKA
jgi:hypothetical protein